MLSDTNSDEKNDDMRHMIDTQQSSNFGRGGKTSIATAMMILNDDTTDGEE